MMAIYNLFERIFVMKTMIIFLMAYYVFFTDNLQTQIRSVVIDTAKAEALFIRGQSKLKSKQYDSSTVFFRQSAALFRDIAKNSKVTKEMKRLLEEKALSAVIEQSRSYVFMNKTDTALYLLDENAGRINDLYGERSIQTAKLNAAKGFAFDRKNDFSGAIRSYEKAILICDTGQPGLRENLSRWYYGLGLAQVKNGDFSSALENWNRQLEIINQINPAADIQQGRIYTNIGELYRVMGRLDLALEFHFKALDIKRKILGKDHSDMEPSYMNIGIVYYDKGEYDLSLEYYSKALQIAKQEKNETEVAKILNNMAVNYDLKKDYPKALEHHEQALSLYRKLYGDDHYFTSASYCNIGIAYDNLKQYEKALEFQNKALMIRKKQLPSDHPWIAECHTNLGLIYQNTGRQDTAIFYFQKALQSHRNIYSDKNHILAGSLNRIGEIYSVNGQYDEALKYFQLSLAASVPGFNDTLNYNSWPSADKYMDWKEFLNALYGKAKSLRMGVTGQLSSSLSSALYGYRLCDTLINKTRREITTLSDKISLGEKASQVYEDAVQVCLELAKETSDPNKSDEYKQRAFYFSEKNKASVLLESLSGQQALKFSGIPDSLLGKERVLRIDINFYNKQLAEMPDSAKQVIMRDRLFSLNRSYDSLIAVFENQYPDYYNLKYSESTASVPDIQKQLDESSAMISYFAGDSTITIFTITRKSISIEQRPTPKDFTGKIELYRRSLIRVSALGQRSYKNLATEFYDLLIPKKLDKKIKSLIIIPDQALATIPFETFLTKPVTDKTDMHKLPYLISQYGVSYSYSATLFMKTFPKEQTKEIEMHDLNDWLAFAPVADTAESGMSFASRELLNRYQNGSAGSVQTRALRDYFAPLPGTLSEVSTILDLFDKSKAKAKIEVNRNADEKAIKSGLLKDYRILHFATHGMVHNEKPELSCILMASADSGDTENDGILFSGEIFNLILNADLVVLSACETGLGKIKKGEGILGLTRALLYAGSKNIIVSLWQVADQSTSDLMIDFYKELLKKDLSKSDYSGALQQAKTRMIKNKQNAHPFYWSPFVLIGK